MQRGVVAWPRSPDIWRRWLPEGRAAAGPTPTTHRAQSRDFKGPLPAPQRPPLKVRELGAGPAPCPARVCPSTRLHPNEQKPMKHPCEAPLGNTPIPGDGKPAAPKPSRLSALWSICRVCPKPADASINGQDINDQGTYSGWVGPAPDETPLRNTSQETRFSEHHRWKCARRVAHRDLEAIFGTKFLRGISPYWSRGRLVLREDESSQNCLLGTLRRSAPESHPGV